MKHGKRPTLVHKKLMRAHGLDPDEWLVVRDQPTHIEIVKKSDLKKIFGKARVKVLIKDIQEGNSDGKQNKKWRGL